MGQDSKIAWTDHTFNAWIGCSKVSPGCKNCYAEVDTFARTRRSRGLELWGVDAARHVTGKDNWRKPLAWNRAAEKAGTRARVFCASMADVFEDRPDLLVPRARLIALTCATPHLDWLLLTKRPENADRLWQQARRDMEGDDSRARVNPWASNHWLGTTAESQEQADRRIPHLLAVPAAVRFLSVEPQLGPVSLDRYFGLADGNAWAECLCDQIDPSDVPCIVCDCRRSLGEKSGIGWAICGGESGVGARPFDLAWARSLRDQCAKAGVPFFMKQTGSSPIERGIKYRDTDDHPSGAEPVEWPEDLRVREFPKGVG